MGHRLGIVGLPASFSLTGLIARVTPHVFGKALQIFHRIVQATSVNYIQPREPKTPPTTICVRWNWILQSIYIRRTPPISFPVAATRVGPCAVLVLHYRFLIHMIHDNHRNRPLLFHKLQSQLFLNGLKDRNAIRLRRLANRSGRLVRSRTRGASSMPSESSQSENPTHPADRSRQRSGDRYKHSPCAADSGQLGHGGVLAADHRPHVRDRLRRVGSGLQPERSDSSAWVNFGLPLATVSAYTVTSRFSVWVFSSN